MVSAVLFLGVVEAAAAPSAEEVRQAAVAAGLGSLHDRAVPEPDNLLDFLKATSDARRAAIRLGKALFWDMQVGSDGQACGTCHFHAGADSRSKNQLNPGMKNVDPDARGVFDPMATGVGGPNHQLSEEDFPFRKLADAEDRTSAVLHDTNDVCSSQGVFNATFAGVVPGRPGDLGNPVPDAMFSVNGLNVRRVEPRNTPTMINAVFNFANFWDGRAHNVFNGVSPLGPLDENARILVKENGTLVPRAISLNNSSLASQAVGPPGSDLEMSFLNRPFRDVGRKLLSVRPLALQLVHPKDSVLGSLSRAGLSDGRAVGKKGISTSYRELIKTAFKSRYWDSSQLVDGYTLMENNFSLFFGIAVQMYEATLIADRSPFDKFMEGQSEELNAAQRRGLLTFINRGPGQSDDPIFVELGVGNCISCHGGPELTDAAIGNLAEEGELELIELEETPELMDGQLFIGPSTTFLDNGFSNIGVRPSVEDLGRGGMELGKPLAFVRQRLLGFDFAPELPGCGGEDQELCPDGDRVSVDGAFKVPGLRNVELTGPYFHNGGQATLTQVVEFYDRQGDFSNENLADLDRQIARISLEDEDEQPLVAFLLSLTDERVRKERAPFDHPQLFVPNGHAGDHSVLECVHSNGMQACDDLFEALALGEKGRHEIGLRPLGTFLGVEHLESD